MGEVIPLRNIPTPHAAIVPDEGVTRVVVVELHERAALEPRFMVLRDSGDLHHEVDSMFVRLEPAARRAAEVAHEVAIRRHRPCPVEVILRASSDPEAAP